MSNKSIVNVTFILTAYITLGFGIYGLSESIMAAICLPISHMCYACWKEQ